MTKLIHSTTLESRQRIKQRSRRKVLYAIAAAAAAFYMAMATAQAEQNRIALDTVREALKTDKPPVNGLLQEYMLKALDIHPPKPKRKPE